MKNKNKLKKLIICMLCVICTLITFTPVNANATTKVTLSNTKITLRLGNTKVLKLKNAKGKVTWKTSNAKVVSIKKKDATSITLTPKKQGKVTITATNNKKAYTCKVNVPKMKYDTWEDETVMLGYINTVWEENPSSTMSWSIEDKSIASIKPFGKKNSKCKIEALTHGETTMKIVDGGITHIMKVIVPEVKLDVAKVSMDSSKYSWVGSSTSPYSVTSYYDENGNDITNTFELWEFMDKGECVNRRRTQIINGKKKFCDVKFIGTDITMWDVKWESSNPEKITIDESGGYCFEKYPIGKGNVTFTTKLGNETFSFIFEYNTCELPDEVGCIIIY